MDSATGSSGRSGSVLASFLLPHAFLDRAADGDTAEMLVAKARKNKAWLLRWLPVYLQRWLLLLVASWLMATLSPWLELPAVLGWAFELAQVVCVYAVAWLTAMYVSNRMAAF
jgi:hypothetical protein